MGVRKTTDLVEKITWGLAAVMVVISVICAHTAPKAITEESVMEKAATQTETTNPTNMPGFGATQPTKGNTQQAPAAPAAENNK